MTSATDTLQRLPLWPFWSFLLLEPVSKFINLNALFRTIFLIVLYIALNYNNLTRESDISNVSNNLLNPLNLVFAILAPFIVLRLNGLIKLGGPLSLNDSLTDAIGPAIIEELAFRNLIVRNLQGLGLPDFISSWCSGLLFGIVHGFDFRTLLSCFVFHEWMMSIKPYNMFAHFWWNLFILANGEFVTNLNEIELSAQTIIVMIILALCGRVL